MKDPRQVKLAEILVNHSIKLKKGESCLIEAYDVPDSFIEVLVSEVYKAGAYPEVELRSMKIIRSLLKTASVDSLELMADSALYRMKKMDAYIGVRGVLNAKELTDLPDKQNSLYKQVYYKPVHLVERVENTRWVVLRFPTESMAMSADMSTEGFEEYYFRVACGVDYTRMFREMKPAVKLLESSNEVHITGPGTDLRFSIRDMTAMRSAGEKNIPDGEIFTCPVKNSVNGQITYNVPSTFQGYTFKDVSFTFREGKIIRAEANDSKRLNSILDTDPGARYIGEFAFGCNPGIIFPMDDPIFDEKIAGSFHFTPGNAYTVTDNGNRSAIHWDLVCIQTPAYGGGEIRLDGELIRKDGVFIHKAFSGLN